MAVLFGYAFALCPSQIGAQSPAGAAAWLDVETWEGTAEWHVQNDFHDEVEGSFWRSEGKAVERKTIGGPLRLTTQGHWGDAKRGALWATGTWVVQYEYFVQTGCTEFSVSDGQPGTRSIRKTLGSGQAEGTVSLTLQLDRAAGNTHTVVVDVPEMPIETSWNDNTPELRNSSFAHFTKPLPVGSLATALTGTEPGHSELGYGAMCRSELSPDNGRFTWTIRRVTSKCTRASSKYAFPVDPSANPRMRDSWNEARKYRQGPHRGVDIYVPQNTEVSAVIGGTVYALVTRRAGGNILFIRDQDGNEWGYMHLEGYADGIKPGVPVKTGQPVGRSGRTGVLDPKIGPHLHVDVKDWRAYYPAKRANDKAAQERAYWNPYQVLQEAREASENQSNGRERSCKPQEK